MRCGSNPLRVVDRSSVATRVVARKLPFSARGVSSIYLGIGIVPTVLLRPGMVFEILDAVAASVRCLSEILELRSSEDEPGEFAVGRARRSKPLSECYR